jgi:hypothetical protein
MALVPPWLGLVRDPGNSQEIGQVVRGEGRLAPDVVADLPVQAHHPVVEGQAFQDVVQDLPPLPG